MKVLHIMNELNASGAETMLESAYKYWNDAGLDLHILSTGCSLGPYSSTLRKCGYKIHHLPLKRVFKIPTFFYFIDLLLFFKKGGYQLIHIHPEKASTLYVLVAFLSRIPAIRTVHHIFYRENNFLGYTQWIIRLINRALCKIFNIRVVSNSDSGWSNEKRLHRSDNAIIYNWYDDGVFIKRSNANYVLARSDLNIDLKKIYILSVGGNWGYKNYDIILRALALLSDEYRSKIIYSQIGSDKYSVLKKMSHELELSDIVRIEGRVVDIKQYLNAADCFLMPSATEGFGCAAVEAMAVGVFVALSDKPALIDFKKYIDAGIWLDPTVDNLVLCLKKIVDMGPLALFEMGEKNTIVKSQFSAAIGAEEYLKLYDELVLSR